MLVILGGKENLELSAHAPSAAVFAFLLPELPYYFFLLKWLRPTRTKKQMKAAMMGQKIQNGMKRRKQMIMTVVKMQHEPAQSYPVTVLKLSKNSVVLPFAAGAAVYYWGGFCNMDCCGATG